VPYLPDGNLGVRRRLASGAHHGQRHLGCAVLADALADPLGTRFRSRLGLAA